MSELKKKKYSSVVLSQEFELAVSAFLYDCANDHTPTHLQNMRRRCRLFLKCMQFWGRTQVEDITYEDIEKYDKELSHLKEISRIIEESTLHQFLKYLADSGRISSGRYLYMYLIECNCITKVENLSCEEQESVNTFKSIPIELTSDEFLEVGMELVSRFVEKGYNKDYVKEIERVIRVLFLFLDLNNLGYNPKIASIWLNSDAAKSVIHGKSQLVARRVLNVFRDYCESGDLNFRKVYRKGITGLDELPDWCRLPLMEFADQRTKEKLDATTVKNDIYSLLRFCRFIINEGLSSYKELTGEIIHKFNIADVHGSPEGKNSCNNRIKRFLKYLYREGHTSTQGLHHALGTTAVSVETVVCTLDKDETNVARAYINSAVTPMELRDSAIFLLGADMGMRGSDIVALKLSDIDWKKQSIRFIQDKTDSAAWLAMPTSVGNAIYRYLRYGRPRETDSEYVFVSNNAPFSRLTRGICYGTLHRILPNRKIDGSGFHVTRKSFSSNRLRNCVRPTMIADAIGHSGTGCLTPYLSLDKEKMSKCPLSLGILHICFKGGF